MAALLVTFLTVLCFNLFLTQDLSISEHCDTLKGAQQEDKLGKLIRRLPKDYMITQTKVDILGGFNFLGVGDIYGLYYLEQDRPCKRLCHGKDTATVYSVRSWSIIRLVIPWKLCSGPNGTIFSGAGIVRSKGKLVATKTGACTNYWIENVMPVILEGVYLGMSGGGKIVYAIVRLLGFILSGLVRMLWVQGITRSDEGAIRGVLEEPN